MIVRIIAPFRVRSSGHAATQLEEHVDTVASALFEMDDVFDVSMGMDSSEGIVEFDVSAEGDSEGQAVDLALACIRTAIHAAGGHTHDWPTGDDALPGLGFESKGEWTRLPKTELVSG